MRNDAAAAGFRLDQIPSPEPTPEQMLIDQEAPSNDGVFTSVLLWQPPPESWKVRVTYGAIETDRGPARWVSTRSGVFAVPLEPGEAFPRQPLLVAEAGGPLPRSRSQGYDPMTAVGRKGLLAGLLTIAAAARNGTVARVAPLVFRRWGPLERPLAECGLVWSDQRQEISAPGYRFEMPAEVRSPGGHLLYAEPLVTWVGLATDVERLVGEIAAARAMLERMSGARGEDRAPRSRWESLHATISNRLAATGVVPVVEPGRGSHDATVRLLPRTLLGAVWALLALRLVGADVPLQSTIDVCTRCGNPLPAGCRPTRRYCRAGDPGNEDGRDCAKLAWEENHRDQRNARQRERRRVRA